MNESVENTSAVEKFKRIDELCQLILLQEGETSSWFKDLCASQNDIDPFTSVVFLDEEEKDQLQVALLPQLFHTLHECILNRRWPEVLQIIRMIARKPSGSSQTILKVGNELFQREGDEVLMKQLVDNMISLPDLESKEVMLEYVFFLMKQRKYEEALTRIQEHIKSKRKERTAKDYYVEKLTRAYTGLLWYIEWKNFQHKIEQIKETSQDTSHVFSQMSSMGNESEKLEMQMVNCASKAVMCFQELVGQPGVWDIFVPKHVELLLHQDKLNEALTIVQKYAEMSPESPSAQKILLQFYEEHFPSSENLITQLKIDIFQKMASLVPSDSVVLKLCDKVQSADPKLVCTHLFNLLDYPCWQHDPAPWTRLSDLLKALSTERSKHKESWDTAIYCWKRRKSWWPAYHFSDFRLAENANSDLMFHKAVVAGLLMGEDNTYTTAVLQRLNSKTAKNLQKILENT